MKKMPGNNTIPVLLAGAIGLAPASTALAGSPAMSGIVAEANDAESAFAAPAGMSRLQGTNITIQTMYASPQANFDVDESLTQVGGGDPDLGEDPIIIPSLYYVQQLDDRWHTGFSLTIPTGFGSDYGSEWAGRYEVVDFSLVYISFSPVLSYRVNDKLSVGGGMGINYTEETSEVKIPQGPGRSDGKISSDLDGVGVSVTLSMLYEFTERTRAGIAWTSDSDADLEGNVRLRNLSPEFDQIATRLGIKDINTELTNTLPQRVLAGVYHEFESGKYFTIDTMWMKFSDFSVSDVELNGNDINVSAPEIYNDIWAVTAGMGFPINERMTYKVGAMYLTEAVDDEDRSFSIRLDKMWGVGVGLSYVLTEGRKVDLNANYINVGDASVDTGNGEPGIGRVVGENDDPYALMFELTYHF